MTAMAALLLSLIACVFCAVCAYYAREAARYHRDPGRHRGEATVTPSIPGELQPGDMLIGPGGSYVVPLDDDPEPDEDPHEAFARMLVPLDLSQRSRPELRS